MKLTLISDVHGNLPALEAVIDDSPADSDAMICLGDIVGYGPWPAECTERVQEHCTVVLQGNHDREFVSPEGYTENDQAMAGLRYTQEAVTPSQRMWLQDLPRKQQFLDGDVLLVHDHPEEVDRYVTPRAFPEVRPYLDGQRACFLGHTHIQHEAVIDNRLILNPGSVGQPRDGDNRAAYAVVDTETWETELCRVTYDIERVQREVEKTGLPVEVGNRLEAGK